MERNTLALKCCKDSTDERPKMTEVARKLKYICSMLLKSDSKKLNMLQVIHLVQYSVHYLHHLL